MNRKTIVALLLVFCITTIYGSADAKSLKSRFNQIKKKVEQVAREASNSGTQSSGNQSAKRTDDYNTDDARHEGQAKAKPALVDTIIDHIRYRVYTQNRKVVVMGPDDYLYMETTEITLPDHIKIDHTNYPVTHIDNGAFYGETLHKITLPSTLREIGRTAFLGTRNLKEIVFPARLRTLKASAFACSGLQSVTIPPGLRRIESSVFAGSNITTITLPSTVKEIEIDVFRECNSLLECNLPEGIKEIPEGMFMECKAIKTFNVPASVKKIGSNAFAYCPKLASITLPEGLTEIKEGAFNNCKSLTSIYIPSSVTTIDESVFISCSALAKATLPATFNDLMTLATIFTDCTKLFGKTEATMLENFTFN